MDCHSSIGIPWATRCSFLLNNSKGGVSLKAGPAAEIPKKVKCVRNLLKTTLHVL